MKQRFLGVAFCILSFFAASALPQSEGGNDGKRRLVTVDENSKKSILKEVLSSEYFSNLGEPQKSLIKNVIAEFCDKYQTENSYFISDLDVFSVMDSLRVLPPVLSESEEEIAILDSQINSLEDTKKKIDDLLDSLPIYTEERLALNNELSEKRLYNNQQADEIKHLEAKLSLLVEMSTAEQNNISELLGWKEKLMGEYQEQMNVIDRAILTAHESKIADFNIDDFFSVKDTYFALQPVVSILNSDWTARVENELSYIDELGIVGKSISEGRSYLSGLFDNPTRLSICNDLIFHYNNLKWKAYFSDEQLDEIYYVMRATGAQGRYRDKLYSEIVRPMYKLGSISDIATLETWQNKIREFKEEMESEDEELNMIWPQCKTLVNALSELGDFVRLDYGRIPFSVSDPDQFKARLQTIWGNVESKELH